METPSDPTGDRPGRPAFLKPSYWIRTTKPAEGLSEPLAEGDGLGDGAKIVAGGFALFTTVYTTLGVQTGELSSIFGLEPWRSLYLVCLIGVATVGGIVVPLVRKELWTRYVILLLPLGGMAFLSLITFQNLKVPDPFGEGAANGDVNGSGASWLGIVLVVLVIVGFAIALALLGARWLTAASALFFAALFLLGLGLFGTIKLVHHTRVERGKIVQIVPTVTAGEGGSISLKVKASSLPLRADVEIVITPAGGQRQLGETRVRLSPNGDGTLDETLAVPLADDLTSVKVEGVVCQKSTREPLVEPTSTTTSTTVPPDNPFKCEVVYVADITLTPPTTTTTAALPPIPPGEVPKMS